MLSYEEGALRWAAQSSLAQTWVPSVLRILGTLHNADELSRLGITLQKSSLSEAEAMQRPWNEKQLDTLKQSWKYFGSRCWSQAHFASCFPQFMAGCFAESNADRDGSMRLMKKIWDSVLKAE